jgi:hypothetical protein
LNILPKEGDTMDIRNSQSKAVSAGNPQTVEVEKAMVNASARNTRD